MTGLRAILLLLLLCACAAPEPAPCPPDGGIGGTGAPCLAER